MVDRTRHMAEGAESPLDVAHLGRQTLGDAGLKREVLRLFDDHALKTLAIIKSADGVGRREAAHALVGAARGIGAFVVSRTAGAIEKGDGDSPEGVAALEAAIDEARRAIAEHLSE